VRAKDPFAPNRCWGSTASGTVRVVSIRVRVRVKVGVSVRVGVRVRDRVTPTPYFRP
jgi:hypothetical protein